MKLHFSWELLRGLNIASAIGCAGLGYLAGPSWIGMLDTAVVGYNLAAALWITRPIIPMMRSFEGMQAALNNIVEMNDVLIHNRVMLHFQDESPPPEPADEHKPRLH